MAPTAPADPVLPGATRRPLARRDAAAALEPGVDAVQVAGGGEEVRTADELARELTDPPAPTNTLGIALPDRRLAPGTTFARRRSSVAD